MLMKFEMLKFCICWNLKRSNAKNEDVGKETPKIEQLKSEFQIFQKAFEALINESFTKRAA